ncbi:transglutaminase domain-containing protein [Butyricimonas paravirosa]|uniref:transglutaminase domain-containing protein n=1 Tax=Butyricimonas paravirosa TaxID=1472417 RepID=UPI00210BDDC5|nr:transglutaminase domain-containing protein [Butyricimonas paravirosa]MCQ4875558.1 hypothetical protein [Butyricimonas paravirosa]
MLKWLLLIGIMLSCVPVFAQVTDREEELRERGGSVAGDATFEEIVAHVARLGTTDRERVILLSGWFYKYMTLDVDKFLTGETGGDYREMLKNGKGICEDFAGLFRAFCDRLNIRNGRVEGYVQEEGMDRATACKRINHVWNAVYVEGEWWHVDMLWAIGTLGKTATGEWVFTKRWNPAHVLTRRRDFLETHLPADPAWQLVDRPYSVEEFIEGALKETGSAGYYNYKDSIDAFMALPRDEQQMLFARRANRFNPLNKEVMAVTFYNEGVFLLNYNRRTRAILERVRDYFRIAREYARDLPDDARRVKESIDEGLRNVEASIK